MGRCIGRLVAAVTPSTEERSFLLSAGFAAAASSCVAPMV